MVNLPKELMVDVIATTTIEPTIRIKTKSGWVTIGEWVATEEGLTAVPRDEFHTMEELYFYRMLYNAHAANAWAAWEMYPVVKSWRHPDGELCFGGGWFVVVATLPRGQVSNHYKAEFWSWFRVPEVARAPEYDGHTPEQAANRLEQELDGLTRIGRTFLCPTCKGQSRETVDLVCLTCGTDYGVEA